MTPPPDRAIPVLWHNFIRKFNVPGRLDSGHGPLRVNFCVIFNVTSMPFRLPLQDPLKLNSMLFIGLQKNQRGMSRWFSQCLLSLLYTDRKDNSQPHYNNSGRNTGCLCRAIRVLSPSGPSAGAETGLSRLHGDYRSDKHSTLQSCQRRGSVAVWAVLAAIAASVSGRVRRVSSQSVALCLSCRREWLAQCRLSCGGAPDWCVC